VWLATGCGAGYLPFMPGTYGSALGVLLYLGLAALARTTAHPAWVLGVAAVAVIALSIWVASLALRSFYEPDPQVIVLDEVAGQVLTLLPLPLTTPLAPSSDWIAVGIGFLLFRALDALKPYPIWKFERYPGVWGVMGDDLAAGLIAAAALCAILWIGFGV
jgi:phosphatidylglycerophosphatase A